MTVPEPYPFSFTVEYKNGEKEYTSSVLGAEWTEEAAMEHGVVYHKAYYEGLGYVVTYAAVERICPACNGRTTIERPTRGRLKSPWMPLPPCKTCKGSGVAEVLYSEGVKA